MINEWHVRKMIEVKKLYPELDKIPRSKLFLVLLTSSVVFLLKGIGFVSTEIKNNYLQLQLLGLNKDALKREYSDVLSKVRGKKH